MYDVKLTFFYDDAPINKNMPVTSHMHNCFELVYFISANGTLTINDEEMHISSGNIYGIYPGTPHSEIHHTDGRVAFFGFDCPEFPKDILYEGVYKVANHKKYIT